MTAAVSPWLYVPLLAFAGFYVLLAAIGHLAGRTPVVRVDMAAMPDRYKRIWTGRYPWRRTVCEHGWLTGPGPGACTAGCNNPDQEAGPDPHYPEHQWVWVDGNNVDAVVIYREWQRYQRASAERWEADSNREAAP